MATKNPTPTSPGEPDKTSRVRWLRRMAGYAFWTALGAMLPVALDRLIIHPILNQELGADVFGAFIWVLGIVNLFGNVAANGFTLLLMRDHARQEHAVATRMFRTALILTAILSIVILPVALGASALIANKTVLEHGWPLFTLLGVYALARAGLLILILDLRFKRRFKAILAMRAVEALILLLIIAVAPTRSLWLIGIIYVASVLVMAPIGAKFTSAIGSSGGWFDSRCCRALLGGWYAGALLTLIEQSNVYASRLVLGVFADTSEVAILYAGTAMGNLFVMPVSIIATLVVSLLGGRRDFVFAGRKGVLYMAATFGLAIIVGSASWVFGRWLVSTQYPDLASQTLQFYHWIAIANGCVCVKLMISPVVLKYSSLRAIILLTTTSFLIQIAVLAVFIPRLGATGAAMGLASGSGAAMALWFANALRMWRSAGTNSLHFRKI
ncbi:MAG: hypothetical protein IID30_02815 [Planctomycetes bacterium]|nr:hypothetical protein [Planctomycetota bacterium]